MVALRMEDLKGFTAGLFMGELFDGWLVREAEIVTFNRFTIDGRIRQGYYSDWELEQNRIEDLSSGKKLPESFYITLQLPPAQTEDFLKKANLEFTADQVAGLYLNIRYENGVLSCITGTSLKIFTLDKRLEYEWDETVRQYFKKKQVPFT